MSIDRVDIIWPHLRRCALVRKKGMLIQVYALSHKWSHWNKSKRHEAYHKQENGNDAQCTEKAWYTSRSHGRSRL
jgi:hypothetical protein